MQFQNGMDICIAINNVSKNISILSAFKKKKNYI